MRASALASALTVLVVGCHSARSVPASGVQADTCRETRDSLPGNASAAGLAGHYRLKLTATAGPAAGRSIEGPLRLAPISDPAARVVTVLGRADSTARYALRGTAELDRESLGAASTGELTSDDPAAPGVLVIERHPARPPARADIMLRLGADANRKGIVRYDGGYFALTVRTIKPDAFAGTWSSGVGARKVGGYFCATRLSEPS
jgi:hypothetical protein